MNQPIPNPDRWKNLVVFLTVVSSVVATAVAGLQADANIRANTANRDSQLYALQIAAELHRQGLQSHYDTGTFSTLLKDAQEATVLQLTALDLAGKGDEKGAAATLLQATVAEARATRAEAFSIFYTDPRYVPATPGGFPNFDAYLHDSYVTSNDLLAKQNEATDQYNRWSQKGDTYVTILTILAVALFLLGLAQALQPRQRLLCALFGVLTVGVASLWTVVLLIS